MGKLFFSLEIVSMVQVSFKSKITIHLPTTYSSLSSKFMTKIIKKEVFIQRYSSADSRDNVTLSDYPDFSDFSKRNPDFCRNYPDSD